MNKKYIGYGSLLLSVIMMLTFIKNFFYIRDRRLSFIEETFGIYEPISSLLVLFLSIVFLSFFLYVIFEFSKKKIIKLLLLSSFIIALLPVILIMIHAGEL